MFGEDYASRDAQSSLAADVAASYGDAHGSTTAVRVGHTAHRSHSHSTRSSHGGHAHARSVSAPPPPLSSSSSLPPQAATASVLGIARRPRHGRAYTRGNASPAATYNDVDDDDSMFGSLQQQQQPPLKTVDEIIRDLDAEQQVSGPKGGCCARVFIPLAAAAVLVLVVCATLWTSGSGVDVAASPRVALLLVDGLPGTIFDAVLQQRSAAAATAAAATTAAGGGAGVAHGLPNMQLAFASAQRGGVWASCGHAESAHCARAAVVEDGVEGTLRVCAACALTSILSGVSPALHGVRNDTLDAVAEYATSSKVYPSIARRVMAAARAAQRRRRGDSATDAYNKSGGGGGVDVNVGDEDEDVSEGGVVAVGTSSLLHSFDGHTGRCTRVGVLDTECAASARDARARSVDELTGLVSLDCLAARSCNTHTRRLRQPTRDDAYDGGSDARASSSFTRQLYELFGDVALHAPSQTSATQNAVADRLRDALFLFHFDELAVRAESALLTATRYDDASLPFTAQLYMLDALVGQLLAFVHDRSRAQKENWLVLLVGVHGGHNKTHTGDVDVDGAVAFAMTTYTSNTRGFVQLKPLSRPTSQLDVLPTVLRWLNIAPYDDATEAYARRREGAPPTGDVAGGRGNAAADKGDGEDDDDAAAAAQWRARAVFAGQVQGICSSGVAPLDCVA